MLKLECCLWRRRLHRMPWRRLGWQYSLRRLLKYGADEKGREQYADYKYYMTLDAALLNRGTFYTLNWFYS